MSEKKLNTVLKGDVVEHFKAVKEHFGMRRNSSVLCVLIAEKYHQIQRYKVKRVPIDDETYAKLEEQAKQEGCSVDELVNQIVEKFMKLAKADPDRAMAVLKEAHEAEKEATPKN
jgi:predicted CopG family antitoxin